MGYDVIIRKEDINVILDIKGTPQDVSQYLAPIGLNLPDKPNTSTVSNEGYSLYLIGSNHWLLRTALAREATLLQQLSVADVPANISQVVISDSHTFFSITGPDADQIIATACPLDIHPSVFPENGVSFTQAFGIKVLLIRMSDSFELAVDFSYDDMFSAYWARICGAG